MKRNNMSQSKIIYKLQKLLRDKSGTSQYVVSLRSYNYRTITHRASKILQPVNTVPHNQNKDNANKNKEFFDNSDMSKSSMLLADNGLIKHAYPGNYVFLPLGMRVLQKVSKLIDNCMQSIDGQKLLLPTLTEGKLWEKTGRLDKMKDELLSTHDRHKRHLIFR